VGSGARGVLARTKLHEGTQQGVVVGYECKICATAVPPYDLHVLTLLSSVRNSCPAYSP
jgi:hypothetical protein